MPSGQIYLAGCLNLIRELADKAFTHNYFWDPAHQNVAGNEIAGQHAKTAVQEAQDPRVPHNRHIRLAAADG